jgi:hypothetical protein
MNLWRHILIFISFIIVFKIIFDKLISNHWINNIWWCLTLYYNTYVFFLSIIIIFNFLSTYIFLITTIFLITAILLTFIYKLFNVTLCLIAIIVLIITWRLLRLTPIQNFLLSWYKLLLITLITCLLFLYLNILIHLSH